MERSWPEFMSTGHLFLILTRANREKRMRIIQQVPVYSFIERKRKTVRGVDNMKSKYYHFSMLLD